MVNLMMEGVAFVTAKVFSLLGFVLAILLSVGVTVPYLVTWRSLDLESREVNLVNVKGVNYGEDGSLINVTLISVYPKAAVERSSNIFVVQMVFLLSLNPNVKEFICGWIEVNFRSVTGTDEYSGMNTLDFWTGTLANFYRWSDRGNIAPFSENVSIIVNSARWPLFSQDLARLFYLTDRIETYPSASLSASIRTINGEWSFVTVFFNMTSHTTVIYRFNHPPTIWVVYGCSLFIAAVVSVNLLYHRKNETKTKINL
jgi:hypothetical protein